MPLNGGRDEAGLGMLTIARRMVAAVLATWKRGKAYDPKRHGSRIGAHAGRSATAERLTVRRTRATGSRESIQLPPGSAGGRGSPEARLLPSKYRTKRWPREALPEVWCSLLRE